MSKEETNIIRTMCPMNCHPTLCGMLAEVRGGDARLDAAVNELKNLLADSGRRQANGRRIARLMALTLQAALLLRSGPAYLADAFCASRLEDAAGGTYGALPDGLAVTAIIERAHPGLN